MKILKSKEFHRGVSTKVPPSPVTRAHVDLTPPVGSRVPASTPEDAGLEKDRDHRIVNTAQKYGILIECGWHHTTYALYKFRAA